MSDSSSSHRLDNNNEDTSSDASELDQDDEVITITNKGRKE
jgi:hypothetical protein